MKRSIVQQTTDNNNVLTTQDKTNMIKNLLFKHVLFSLRVSAHAYLKIKKPKIVGVTGSVGKSSFLHLLRLSLGTSKKIKVTEHGNSETGLPLEILGLRKYVRNYTAFEWLFVSLIAPFAAILAPMNYDILIAEMGIDSPFPPKNMKYLLKFIHPDIGVLLSIAPVHTQQFSQLFPANSDKQKILQAIAHEKGLLLTTLSEKGYAIYNSDAPFMNEVARDIRAHARAFGTSTSALYRVVSVRRNEEGTTFELYTEGNKQICSIRGYVLIDEYGLLIAASLATAHELGISPETAVQNIEKGFSLPPGRMSLIKGIKHTTIIDSSYNSSPDALHSGLRMFQSLKIPNKKKVIVLGDMRELGPLEAAEHEDIAKEILNIKGYVVFVGPLMGKYLYPKLLREGYTKKDVAIFPTSIGVATHLKNHVLTGDEWIFVKGSQNTIFLERTIKELMQNPEDAKKLLCRQDEYWEHIRNNA